MYIQVNTKLIDTKSKISGDHNKVILGPDVGPTIPASCGNISFPIERYSLTDNGR